MLPHPSQYLDWPDRGRFATSGAGVKRGSGMGFAFRAAALAVALAGTVSSAAAQVPVVVELYTSQGCSSCPPADAFLAEMAPRDDVIALALHVDYWDYLGWKDPFAHARFTERQKAYARAAGSKMIYTPQLIIAGAGRVQGFQPSEIRRLIAQHQTVAPTVRIELARERDVLRIRAVADRPLDVPAVVQLVRYRPSETMTIERGENAGRTDTFHNIVTAWEAIAQWSGTGPLALEAMAPGSDPVVVIVQEPGPGAIIAAARLR